MYHQSTTRLTEDLGEGGFGHRVPASGHHTDDPSRRSGLSRDPDESMCDLCPATIGHWTPRSQGDQPLRDALGAPFLRATSDGKGDREDRVPADRRGFQFTRRRWTQEWLHAVWILDLRVKSERLILGTDDAGRCAGAPLTVTHMEVNRCDRGRHSTEVR